MSENGPSSLYRASPRQARHGRKQRVVSGRKTGTGEMHANSLRKLLKVHYKFSYYTFGE